MKRVFWSLLAAGALALAFANPLDEFAGNEAADALKRALVTFALSRALNGAISVAQGTELALEPAGVGVILTVGQILDPINDLVERFSTIMLVASTSIGLQQILLRITSSWGFDLALGAAALFTLLTLWLPYAPLRLASAVAQRLLLLTILLRLALPVLILGSQFVFTVFLEQEQTAALTALQGVQADIEELNEQQPTELPPPQSLLERLDSMMDDTLAALDVREPLERLRDRLANASEHIVNLIVIFLLQTVLLPIAFIWLFVEVLKSIGRRMAG